MLAHSIGCHTHLVGTWHNSLDTCDHHNASRLSFSCDCQSCNDECRSLSILKLHQKGRRCSMSLSKLPPSQHSSYLKTTPSMHSSALLALCLSDGTACEVMKQMALVQNLSGIMRFAQAAMHTECSCHCLGMHPATPQMHHSGPDI